MLCYKYMIYKGWHKPFTGRRDFDCQSAVFRLITFTTYRRPLGPLDIYGSPNFPFADEDGLFSRIYTSIPNELSRLLPILCLINIGPPFDLESIGSDEVDIYPFFSLCKALWFLEEYFYSCVLRRRNRKAGPFHDLDRVISGVTVGNGGSGGVSGGLVLFHE